MSRTTTHYHTPNVSARIGKPAYIAIHRMQGYLNNTIREFESSASQVSCDRCMNKTGTEVAVFNVAATGLKTWEVGNGNSLAMGIETEGFVGDEATLTNAFFDCLADQCLILQKQIKDTYGVVIPMAHSVTKGHPGIVGHVQLGTWYGGSDHSCPGPDFPYAKLINAIRAKQTPQYYAEILAGGKPRKRVRYGEGRVKALLDNRKFLARLLTKYGSFRVKRVKAR
jgi:hypothetical protein